MIVITMDRNKEAKKGERKGGNRHDSGKERGI